MSTCGMHRNRNHYDFIQSILIYGWPNKTKITSTRNIYGITYITQKFIHIQRVWLEIQAY